MPALFELRDVTVRHGTTDLLRGVTVDLPDGGVTAVVGASGSGKSTLLRCCNRLEVPSSGTVRYRGADLAGCDPLAHRRRCGMVFQAPTTFPGTVLDNLRAADPALPEAGASDLLARVGLDPHLLDRTADVLSGGEAQRLVVARARATGPEALLADEATSALDVAATARLEELARSLADAGMQVVWVTHDLAQAERLADHLVVLAAGRLAWAGPADGPGAHATVARILGADPA